MPAAYFCTSKPPNPRGPGLLVRRNSQDPAHPMLDFSPCPHSPLFLLLPGSLILRRRGPAFILRPISHCPLKSCFLRHTYWLKFKLGFFLIQVSSWYLGLLFPLPCNLEKALCSPASHCLLLDPPMAWSRFLTSCKLFLLPGTAFPPFLPRYFLIILWITAQTLSSPRSSSNPTSILEAFPLCWVPFLLLKHYTEIDSSSVCLLLWALSPENLCLVRWCVPVLNSVYHVVGAQ